MKYDNIDTLETEAEKAITKLAECALEHSQDASKWRKKYTHLVEHEKPFSESLRILIKSYLVDAGGLNPATPLDRLQAKSILAVLDAMEARLND